MGAYCTQAYIPRHIAKVGEIMEVKRVDFSGAVLVGDKQEIACIPHKGCRLEIVAAVATSHREANLLLPGAVIRYKRSFFFGDRFELPSGPTVSLRHLMGFKLQLAPSTTPAPPVEEVVVRGRMRHESECVPLGSSQESCPTAMPSLENR
jgi:hypothetical protein